MSDTRDPERDQPLPVPGQQSVQAVLIRALAERRDYGIRKYGRPLETHNGRDALGDAWEELLDGLSYLTQLRLERGDQIPGAAALDADAPVLRHCLFPGCLREFDALASLTGNPTRDTWTSTGWKHLRRLAGGHYTCPDHAELVLKHVPQWDHDDHAEPYVSVLRCACGWPSPVVRFSAVGVTAWQEHLLITSETTGRPTE